MDVTDLLDLLDDGYEWTAKRIAAVHTEDLAAPTPCAEWNLGQLLNHLLGALELHLDAVVGAAAGRADPDTDRIGESPALAFGAIAARAGETWRLPGVLERTCAMPFGPTPGSVVAMMSLTEVVVHGWDVGRGTGERVAIPARIADWLIETVPRFVTPAHRGTAFGAALSVGDTSADRLLAFLGRTP
jgi:uncharacterized protein (TIGR03086 family)